MYGRSHESAHRTKLLSASTLRFSLWVRKNGAWSFERKQRARLKYHHQRSAALGGYAKTNCGYSLVM
jgi:hypothetical protein